MSDTTHSEDHDHKKHGFFGVVYQHKSGIAMILSWLAPFAIMLIGYAFAELRGPATWPWRMPVGAWAGVAAQLMCLVAWILYEIWYSTNRATSILQLQIDVTGDIFVLVTFVFGTGAAVNAGTLASCVIVPLIGATIDALQSSILAINNAAGETQRVGAGR